MAKILAIAAALVLGILAIPTIAVAQAAFSGAPWIMNKAWAGIGGAMRSYGAAPGWGWMGGMGWPGYMGAMAGAMAMTCISSSCPMTASNPANFTGQLLVTEDIEEMEHMAWLYSSGARYVLMFPSDEWVLKFANGSTIRIDVEDLRSLINTTMVTVEGIYTGPMSQIMGEMGMMACHEGMGMMGSNNGPGHMGGMMGMHRNGKGEDREDHDHLEVCEDMMASPHIVVLKIHGSGFTAEAKK